MIVFGGKFIRSSIGLYCVIVVFVSSCFRQETSPIESLPFSDRVGIERAASCSSTNLLENFMFKENLEFVFLCTGWNARFPRLFSALRNIEGEKWDRFFAKINDRIFNNTEKLRELIGLIRELDEYDNLRGLENIMQKLTDTNFYDSLHFLFKCMEEKGDDCKDRKIPDKNMIKDFLSNLKADEQFLDDIITVFDKVVVFLHSHKEMFKRILIGENGQSRLHGEQSGFFGSLVSFFSEPEIIPVHRLLANITHSGSNTHLGALLASPHKRRAIIDIFKHISADNMAFYKDVLAYHQLFKEQKNICSMNTNTLILSPKEYLKTYLEKVLQGDLQSFNSFLLEDMALDKYIKSVCPSLFNQEVEISFQGESIRHSLNIQIFKRKILELFDNNHSFAILKYMARPIHEALFVVDNEHRPSFDSLKKVFSKYLQKGVLFVASEDNDSSVFLLDMAASLDEAFYRPLSQIYLVLSEKNSNGIFGALKELGDFFSDKEKELALSIIDVHFKEENFPFLFKFYSEMLVTLKDDIVDIVNTSFSVNNTFFEFMEEISYRFEGEDVLSDLRLFFSRDHIIRILNFLSSNNRIIETERGRLAMGPISLNRGDYSSLKRENESFLQCADKIIEASAGLSDGERLDLDLLCSTENSQTPEPLFNRYAHITDSLGLMPPHFREPFIINFKIMDSLLRQRGENWADFLDGLQETYDSDPVFFDVVYNILQAVPFDAEDPGWWIRAFFRSLARNQTLRTNIKGVFSSFPDVLEDWQQFNSDPNNDLLPVPSFSDSYKCQNYNNQHIGGTPCPDREVFVGKLENIIKMLTREKNVGFSTLYRYLSLLAHPDSETETGSRITLRKLVRALYETTDKTKEVNNREIEFTNALGGTTVEKTTIMERLEGLARETNFDGHYLGLKFINAITTGSYQNFQAKLYKNFLDFCFFAWFCNPGMDANEYRKANNAWNFFSEIQGISDPGQYMAFIRPLKDHHNMKLVTELASFSAFSNLSRILKDRLARDEESFEELLDSKDFRFLSREFLADSRPFILSQWISSLLEKSLEVRNSAEENFLEFISLRANNIPYEDRRRMENAFMNAVIVAHYLGPLYYQDKKQFSSNSPDSFFLIGEKLMGHWPMWVEATPADFNVMEYLEKAQKVLLFLKEKLHDRSSQEFYYRFINQLFFVFKKVLFLESRERSVLDFYNENPLINIKNFFRLLESLKKLSIDGLMPQTRIFLVKWYRR